MRQYFSFNPLYYNYWPIYEVISRYYPIGIDTNSWSEFRKEYPGTKALNQLTNKPIPGDWTAYPPSPEGQAT